MACYFGFFRLLEAEMGPVALMACWIAVVLIVRGFLSAGVAALLSAAAGVVLVGIPAFQAALDPGPDPLEILPAVLLLGSAFGFVVFLGAEIACRAVRRADARIGKKLDAEERRDGDAE